MIENNHLRLFGSTEERAVPKSEDECFR